MGVARVAPSLALYAFQGGHVDHHSNVSPPPTASSSRFKEAAREQPTSHPIPSSEHGISDVSGSVNHRESPSEAVTNHMLWHAVTIKEIGALLSAS